MTHLASPARPRAGLQGVRALAALFLSFCAAPSHAQSTDDRQQPLRIIVATAPGGVPDVLARTIAQQITADSGRTVVVENRLGAGGVIAMNAMATSPADGTSVVLIEGGSYAIAPHITKNNPFVGATPVGLVATAPIYLCATAGLGVSTAPEFISLARGKPGLPYGSSGNGSSHHLAMELLKSRAKIDLTHIPYKGAGQAVIATVSGEVAVSFLGLSTALPQEQAGKLKILGIASAQRNRLTPDIPSIAETTGLDFDLRIPLGVFANGKTPPAVVESLNKAFGKATRAPGVQKQLAQIGIEGSDGSATPLQFAAMVKNEFDFYGKLIGELNLRID